MSHSVKIDNVEAARLKELLETCHGICKRNGWALVAFAVAARTVDGNDATEVMSLRNIVPENMSVLLGGGPCGLIASQPLSQGIENIAVATKVLQDLRHLDSEMDDD